METSTARRGSWSHTPTIDLSVLRRPSMKTRTALAGLALTALLAPLGAVAPAHASGGGGVRDHGACSKGSHWSLKGKHDSGRIEVEGEIHGRQTGQKWHWVIKHNGSTSAKGNARTHGPSRSFSVSRLTTNLAGTDHFTFHATRTATGEVCRGKVSL